MLKGADRASRPGASGRAGTLRAAIAGSVAGAALLLWGAPAGAVAAPGADRCRAQNNEVVEQADIPLAERSLLCLLNIRRAELGLDPLALDRDLADSAREHSRDMIARGFYRHRNPEGEDATDRAEQQGYPGRVGENIYWSPLSTGVSPLDFATAWETQVEDAYPPLLLDPDYEVAGTGLALGTPDATVPGVTGTQVLGMTDTGSRDIALELLVPAECPPARKAVKRAKAKLKKAKGAGRGVGKAKRKLTKRKQLRKRVCNPGAF